MEEELKSIHIDIIRAACSGQSRTQWTTIASRDRLYQFVAMSDQVAQREICQHLGLISTNEVGERGLESVSGDSISNSTVEGPDPRGLKR